MPSDQLERQAPRWMVPVIWFVALFKAWNQICLDFSHWLVKQRLVAATLALLAGIAIGAAL